MVQMWQASANKKRFQTKQAPEMHETVRRRRKLVARGNENLNYSEIIQKITLRNPSSENEWTQAAKIFK